MRPTLSLLGLLLTVASTAAKSTTIGLETEEASRGVSVPLDDCHAIEEYEVYRVAITKKCRFFSSALSTTERRNYIDAVWCLRGRPSTLPNDGAYPGVRDRLDDFVAVHINYTNVIHKNGVLLPWHRHYIHLWETALRTECGYAGGVPYWDWTLTQDLASNPIFNTASDSTDGIDTSLSGDGTYNATEQALRDPTIASLPEGHGGGCVKAGPFKDFPVHLGPFTFGQAYAHAPLPDNAFAYNPRCLQRNLQPAVVEMYNNADIVRRMLSAPDIDAFLRLLDPSAAGVMGAHGGGHDAVGPTMADVFASPQDPVFMLHHAMVDRVWAGWQGNGGAAEREARLLALNGTAVINNPPGEALVTPETVVEFGVLDRPRKLGELMDVGSAEYCYRYE
ncbi:tyrosinase family protein [Aspergillus lucknowensis]|uniref:Tyrosinase copper-binding domain-containing protein n=1 Tax=Aspergillus lucknowensis TaxID=176173 RepID=A0ABR4LCV8_9EURO